MRKFDPSHADRLLSPERRRWQDPEVVLDALGVKAGMVVADIGAGPGFFSLPAARRVGPSGRVYALDVEPMMVERVREQAAKEGIHNLEGLVSQESHLPLPDRAVDVALLVSVLHEALDPSRLLQETVRVLREGGTLAIVEWNKERQEWGPPFEERLAPQQVEDMLAAAGYHSIVPFVVGPRHYGRRGQT